MCQESNRGCLLLLFFRYCLSHLVFPFKRNLTQLPIKLVPHFKIQISLVVFILTAFYRSAQFLSSLTGDIILQIKYSLFPMSVWCTRSSCKTYRSMTLAKRTIPVQNHSMN